LGYAYLSEQTVKNISKPVRVYRILTESKAAGKVIGEKKIKSKTLMWAIGAVGILIVGLAAVAIWNLYFRSTPPHEMADFIDTQVALAATYAQSGRQEDAVKAAKRVLGLNPFFEVDSYGTAFRKPGDRAKFIAGLRRAGLK
jgi:hypothetical protein